MTVGGWLLAGKAHIGHDRALAHWSRLVRPSGASVELTFVAGTRGRPGEVRAALQAWRSPCSAYSVNSSLSEMPRRPASAASRPARSLGSTMVRCTLSSRSQPSSLSSGKLAPLRYQRPAVFDRDIAAKDAVAQQAETAEVRKPR